jgi:hypothetical protein
MALKYQCVIQTLWEEQLQLIQQTALNGWIRSPAHHDVIIQRGVFHHPPMKAMGIGVYKGYACVWFRQEKDTYPALS